MHALVLLAGLLLSNPQNIDLGGKELYGSSDLDQTAGVLRYLPSTKMWQLAIRDQSVPRQLVIGVCGTLNGCTDNFNSVSGFQILNDGDIGVIGNSANLANINTVDSANNDTTFMLGGGATLKRGTAFQIYNNGRFAGDTFDMAASANEQSLVHLSTGVNQTGSASYRLAWGEVHETSTGSGVHLLLDFGTNSGVPNNMVGVNVNNGTDIAGYTSKFYVSSTGVLGTAGASASATTDQAGAIKPGSVAFASLAASAGNGQFVYCTDCTFANPCASGGTGAIAKRLNGAWRCD